MTKIEKQRNDEGADVAVETTRSTEVARESHSDDEFKLTVRKLEMPVRPRGVLAE